MGSLVLLMIEPELPEALSARKLVVETAKHNVITAYDTTVGLELLRRFPNVDAVLVHAHCLREHPTLLDEIKSLTSGKPLIIASPGGVKPPIADYIVDSHQPSELVELLAGPLQADISD